MGNVKIQINKNIGKLNRISAFCTITRQVNLLELIAETFEFNGCTNTVYNLHHARIGMECHGRLGFNVLATDERESSLAQTTHHLLNILCLL